jgi:3-oxoacyl-[acyl-carrier protein] reductase
MDLGLKGKAAVVAGASKGMGRAVAHGLAAEGARVALLARDAAALERAASEIGRATGSETLAIPTDVTKREQVERAIGQAA